ncbi:unannotated protein [freshwater metagenome]|uniref:Unannotated protein n=1 Tax=freshwater metagenome TaxID=449393 RepID=A0A6J7DCC3_9ZZZZ
MGVTGGIRPNAKNVEHMRDQIPDVKHNWGVIGVSRQQWELLEASLRLGGNIRVGVEDNFYLPDGVMVESNGQLVAKAAEMVTASGRQVATVAQAREMLDTPKREVAGVKP